jgi:hypothetical protein
MVFNVISAGVEMEILFMSTTIIPSLLLLSVHLGRSFRSTTTGVEEGEK